MYYAKIYIDDDDLIIETVKEDVEGNIDIAKEFYYNNKKIIFPMTTIISTDKVLCSDIALIKLKHIIDKSERSFNRGDLAFYVEKTEYRKDNGYTFSFRPEKLYYNKRVINVNDKVVIYSHFGVKTEVLDDFVILDNEKVKKYKL